MMTRCHPGRDGGCGAKTFSATPVRAASSAMASLETKAATARFGGRRRPMSWPAAKRYGRAVAEHILAWSQGDGGAVIENMGFPLEYKLSRRPGPLGADQPGRAAAIPAAAARGARTAPSPCRMARACAMPAPPEYSEDKSSAFYQRGARGLRDRQALSPEQRAIARFWSDDPMLSPTPPGHWISIALQILERDDRLGWTGASTSWRVSASRWPMHSSAAGTPSSSTTSCGR